MTALLLTLAIVLIGALLLVAAMVGGVWWHQERIAYQPPSELPMPPADVARIDYVAEDGQRLYGYAIDPAAAPLGVLVAFHGNADLATWQIPWRGKSLDAPDGASCSPSIAAMAAFLVCRATWASSVMRARHGARRRSSHEHEMRHTHPRSRCSATHAAGASAVEAHLASALRYSLAPRRHRRARLDFTRGTRLARSGSDGA